LNTITVGSLFAGIGGFDIASERVGKEVLWQCEKDVDCQKVLRARFPAACLYPDVSLLDPSDMDAPDIITFGSPCQDLSVAGKRGGLRGERSGLFHAATHVISEFRRLYGRPRYAVWENVPGAFSSRNGRDFRAVLSALANIGALAIGWRVLDSEFFRVPQRRRRIFLVADFGGHRASEILAFSESLRGDTPPGRKEGKDTSCYTTGGIGDYRKVVGTLRSSRGDIGGGSENLRLVDGELNYMGDCSGTLQSQREHRQPIVYDMRGNGDGETVCTLTGDHLNRPTDYTPVVCMAHGQGGAEVLAGLSPTLNCNHEQPIAYVARTLRRLTPTECERLQGFPDNWTGLPGMSDTARYRMIGNAVTVNVAEWLLRRI